jgi:hypothetical protein
MAHGSISYIAARRMTFGRSAPLLPAVGTACTCTCGAHVVSRAREKEREMQTNWNLRRLRWQVGVMTWKSGG